MLYRFISRIILSALIVLTSSFSFAERSKESGKLLGVYSQIESHRAGSLNQNALTFFLTVSVDATLISTSMLIAAKLNVPPFFFDDVFKQLEISQYTFTTMEAKSDAINAIKYNTSNWTYLSDIDRPQLTWEARKAIKKINQQPLVSESRKKEILARAKKKFDAILVEASKSNNKWLRARSLIFRKVLPLAVASDLGLLFYMFLADYRIELFPLLTAPVRIILEENG